jgi:hypothetical protein
VNHVDAFDWLTSMSSPGTVTFARNQHWGLTSHLLRARRGQIYAGAVRGNADPTTQVNALLDLLAWTYWEDAPDAPVQLVVGAGDKTASVVDALRTLRHSLIGHRQVTLIVQNPADGEFTEDFEGPYLFADHPSSFVYAGYLQSWLAAEPSGLALDLLDAIGDDRVRLHPQLSTKKTVMVSDPVWLVRLEGLQVGEVSSRSGRLSVGKDGSDGAQSMARGAWLAAGGSPGPILFGPAGLAAAAKLVRAYARHLAPVGGGLLAHGQWEHALESAVLRGAIPAVADGQRLQTPHAHPVVVHDGQVPTRWTRHPANARYIDALMSAGPVPWVLELKVPGGGTGNGYGAYLRKAVAQAVLYRHFLRTATPLSPWLQAAGLDAKLIRSALVYPEVIEPTVARTVAPRLEAHSRVAAEFDVAVITVPIAPEVVRLSPHSAERPIEGAI